MPNSLSAQLGASHREEFATACAPPAFDASERKLFAPLNRHRLARFFSRIELTEDGCWLWRAALTGDWSDGTSYGCFDGTSAHRVAYLWFVGPIPHGYQVDHLCRVRGCVNPAHLEAVTQGTNRLRASHFELLGLCRRGHAMTAENIGTQSNGAEQGRVRFCRACRLLTEQKRQSRRVS